MVAWVKHETERFLTTIFCYKCENFYAVVVEVLPILSEFIYGRHFILSRV